MQAQAFVDAVPLPCLLVDQTDRIYAVNSGALDLLGQGLLGSNYATMLRAPALLDALETCLQDKRPKVAEYFSTEGGQDITYRVSCRFIEPVDAKRDAGGVLVAFEDITHVAQAGQMRRDFVANVSHELRTPLTALMGFIETLRGPAKDDGAVHDRFLGIMESEAQRMNRLVGDLLSLSHVETEERVRPTQKVLLTDILNSTLNSLRPVVDEAAVTLEAAFCDEPIYLNADSDQIRQVLTNLVENAVKYGGSGARVTVKLSYVARDPSLRMTAARLQVIDYGAGIDPIHLPRLTERFYRADSHRSRELGGTGLGLAIVKHIINRHRGRMQIESELGQGSVFTVILPCIPLPNAE
ncbi:MAG: ATP-binding protein [Aliishimia sp.]